MKLSIRDRGIARSTGDVPALALVGDLLARLVGVRRLSLRVATRGAAPRAELVVERRDRISAYRLSGRLLRWTQAAAPRLIARFGAAPRPVPVRP